ncbi:glycosyltransferase, MGT family [Prauserella aidingensis]|uniref:macrolide family glycosyltransferase n=1 Tax=Prauserella aidingensis TaxID=387890 RepID=UPI0020A48C96|nr:macrolide family glycosyltransferase [Prauserella aidingensis]MCP2253992.1 glycosyltransferase, MGT family [Prauserella aidingensis]
MGSHIAFVSITGHGHVRPTLALVSELVARGHRVTYVVGDELAGLVADAGATPVPYSSYVAGNPAPAEMSPDTLAQVPLTYLRENEAAHSAAVRALRADPPHLVVHDQTMFATGKLLTREFDVPGVRTCPTFANHERFSIDALAAQRYPVDPNHPSLVEFHLRLVQLLADNGPAGTDVAAFLGEVAERNIVFLPRSAQLAGDTFDDRFAFVGPCLDATAESEPFVPPAGDGPLVLISLGSAFNDRPEFFRSCAEAFAGEPERVMLATGHLSADLGPLPPNVTAHDWLPFPSVLSHADACVNHGGFGTALMALHYGTPLVLVPQMVENEYASELLAHQGVGRLVDPATVTGETVVKETRAALADERMAGDIARFREEMATAGGAARAADIIEHAL